MNGLISVPTSGGGDEGKGAMHHLFIAQMGGPPSEKIANQGLETKGFQGRGSFITIPIVLRLGERGGICSFSWVIGFSGFVSFP